MNTMKTGGAQDLKSKFAAISHILPPSPSGQAVILYRLLKDLPQERYCLMSREDYSGERSYGSASGKLSASYYHLKTPMCLPETGPGFSALGTAFNARWIVAKRARQIEEIARREGCGLLIACSGDLYDIPAAYYASRRLNIDLALYLFDDYVYQWTGYRRSAAKRFENTVMKHVRAVIVPNEHLQMAYRNRHGIQSTVIHNLSPLPDLDALDKEKHAFDNHGINIVYTGAVYHAQYDAFRNLIAAIQSLKRTDVKLHIYTAQPESELKRQGISGPMLTCHCHISESEVPRVLRSADILFLPLAFKSPIPEVIQTSSPGKMGEYLSSGKAILVHAPESSFVSWYFRNNKCGVVVDKDDSGLLAEGLHKLLTAPEIRLLLGESGRSAAERDFSIDVNRKRFFRLIDSMQGGWPSQCAC